MHNIKIDKEFPVVTNQDLAATAVVVVTNNKDRFRRFIKDNFKILEKIGNKVLSIDKVDGFAFIKDLKADWIHWYTVWPSFQQGGGYVDETYTGNVATAKNHGLRYVMHNMTNVHHIFVIEDDVILHENSITKYLELRKATGCHHFNAAGLEPGNLANPIAHTVFNYQFKDKEYKCKAWYNLGAPVSYYSRLCLDIVGLMDERYVNGMEHCEHTLRICNKGLCPPFGLFLDTYDNIVSLHEDCYQTSTIRNDKKYNERTKHNMALWRKDVRRLRISRDMGVVDELAKY